MTLQNFLDQKIIEPLFQTSNSQNGRFFWIHCMTTLPFMQELANLVGEDFFFFLRLTVFLITFNNNHTIHTIICYIYNYMLLYIQFTYTITWYSCNQSPAQLLGRSRRSLWIFARRSRSCVQWSLAPSNVAGWTSGWTSNTSTGQWTGSGGHGRLVPGRWRRRAEFHDAFYQLSRK